VCDADEADRVCGVIRRVVSDMYGREIEDGVRIQYGGSVKPDNAYELLHKPNIDGALVGGASLKASDFAAIVRAAL
jgi:triosephosphate isomerase